MSKVICDVCGTTYPETATQCPICGCAKNSTAQTAAGNEGQRGAPARDYVKGGRFSKTNVKKRNSGRAVRTTSDHRTGAPSPKDQKQENNKSTMVLVAIVVILLLAIIAVVAYIGIRYFAPSPKPTVPTGTGSVAQSTGTTEPSNVTDPTDTGSSACTNIQLSNVIVELDAVGKAWLLDVELTPADTTDAVIFTSADESVATVSESGMIVAVGGGQTTIYVTCGQITAECRVVCSFGSGEITDPTIEPTEPAPTQPPVDELRLNTKFYDENKKRYDVTLNQPGKQWTSYVGSIPVSEITFYSDNPSIATVDTDGVVTAVGRGSVLIHAQWQGQTVTAIVRCTWAEGATEAPPATEPESGETQPPALATEYHLEMTNKGGWTAKKENGASATINVGDVWTLKFVSAGGTEMTVPWSALPSENKVILEIVENTMTAVNAGKTQIAVNFEGVIYTWYIVVK